MKIYNKNFTNQSILIIFTWRQFKNKKEKVINIYLTKFNIMKNKVFK